MGDRNSRVCPASTGWLWSQKSFVVIEQPFNKDQMPHIRKCGISSQQTPSPGDPMIPQRLPWSSKPEWPMPEVHRSLELPMVPSLLACTHGFHNTWIIFQIWVSKQSCVPSSGLTCLDPMPALVWMCICQIWDWGTVRAGQ